VAKDGVVDREAVLELLEELGLRLELKQVVVSVTAVVDLEGELAHPPVDIALQLPGARVDLLLDGVEDLAAPLFRRVGVDQDEQVICRCCGHGRRRTIAERG
jgi:hypothetical protein